MKRSWWRTGPTLKYAQPVPRPTGGQLVRQLMLLALMVLVWGGGFFAFLGATSSSTAAPVAEVLPTNTPAPAPTSMPTQAATHTPQPASTATVAATAEPTATSRPTEEPTSVPATVAPSPAENVAVSYQRDVQPIFDQICVKCHGGEEVKEGLSLKTHAEVMRGSNNGPVIVAGDPAGSFLIEQIVKGEMPKRGPKLLPAQIRAITDWVAAGAPDN
jgi:mono/diheme cytochrome c family protein